MSKMWVITLLGLFVALLPFLGFPGGVRTFLIVASGLLIFILSLRAFIRARYNSTRPWRGVFKPKGSVVSDINPPL